MSSRTTTLASSRVVFDLPCPRHNHFLEHIHRFGGSTRCILRDLFMPEASLNAVSQVTGCLAKRGYVASNKFFGPTKFIQLGPRCQSRFGTRPSLSRPLGAEKLIKSYAVLDYCCGEIKRKPLLHWELKAAYPNFPDRHYYFHSWYFDFDHNKRRLATIRVEPLATAEHILRKYERTLHEYRQLNVLGDLISRDELKFVIITTGEARHAKLTAAIAEYPWRITTAVLRSIALEELPI